MLSQRLLKLRKDSKLTQQELSSKLGLARTTYSGYELGTSEPDNETLEMLADHYKITVDYLLGREDEGKPGEMSEMHRRLLVGFDTLSEEDKKYLMGLIERMPKNLN